MLKVVSFLIFSVICGRGHSVGNACSNSCDSGVSGSDHHKEVTSPCHPDNYPNNLACRWYSPLPSNSYTQISFNSFHVEAWHDYIKLDGAQNFLLFLNSTSGAVFATAYPNSNFTAEFFTDSSSSYSGFNVTLRTISEEHLLSEYTAYRNASSVVALKSPLFISSNGGPDASTRQVDVMFMNIPNDTNSPVEAWIQYADALSESTHIQSFNSTPTGFTVNWTIVEASTHYRVNVSDGKGQILASREVNHAQTTFEGLPSGTVFNITVIIENKLGNQATISGNAETDVASPVEEKANSVDQTSFRVVWKVVTGSTSYRINVSGRNFSASVSVPAPPFHVGGLSPGLEYVVEIKAVYATGESGPVRFTQITVPGNITATSLSNVGMTSATLSWSPVTGADSYKISVMKDDATVLTKVLTATNHTITELHPGMQYVVHVASANTAGKSPSTNIQFITGLGAPANTEIVSVTKTEFLLRWAETVGATAYKYRCVAQDGSPSGQESTTTETSKLVRGLRPSTEYLCYVKASSLHKESEEASASATTADRECENLPCLHGGTCRELEQGFQCTCAEGRVGSRCEKVFDWCASENCAQNATCANSLKRLGAVCTCNEGFTGDPKKRCIAFCLSSSVIRDNETLSFNVTYSGITAYSNERCNQTRSKASAVCTTSSLGNGRIKSEFATSSVVLVKCDLKIRDVTLKVNASSTDVSADELETQTSQLQVLTSGEKLSEDDAERVADYINDVGTIAKNNEDSVTPVVLTGIVNTADNLISSQSVTIEQPNPPTGTIPPGEPTTKPPVTASQKEKEIKKKILITLTVLAEQVKLPNDTKEIEIETKNMVVKVYEKPITKSQEDDTAPPQGTWFSPVLAEQDAETASENGTNMAQPLNITIPYSALQKSAGSGESVRLSFFLHKDDVLFPSNKTPEAIVAASLGRDLTMNNLENDVKIKYNNLKEKPRKNSSFKPLFAEVVGYECVFWDFDTGSWSKKGCCLDPRDANLTTCSCDHLTNYALLVSRAEVPNDVALQIVSDIGLGLSMAGLILTIIIHCLRQEVRKRRPTQILLHICSNLFGSYLIFLVGISLTDSKPSCVVVAALLQYFFLASWCWMAVYANDMYRSLVLVFNTDKTNYMTKCVIFAYGFPLLITAIDVGVSVGYFDANSTPEGLCAYEGGYDHIKYPVTSKSAYISDNMCWLHEYSLYFGFLLPVGLMLIFNVFVYSMVMKTLLQRGDKVQSSAKKTTAKDNMMISVTVSASTGLCWIVGYLMLLSEDENYLLVMSWIFALVNAFQGVVIFLTTCVRHENMRKIWWRPIKKCCSRSFNRLILLSPKRDQMTFGGMSETGGSSYASTSETKNTTIRSLHLKEVDSETTV